jgi:zinc transport system substrate-binding protein
MKKIDFIVLLILLLTGCKKSEKAGVIVTSSWTAAYVKAAGVTDLAVLAPAEMRHPSEYELDIDDIERLREADLIVCGGYEIMMDRIRNGLKIDPDKIMEIKTDYNLDHMRSSIMAIAGRMGREEVALKNIQEIERTFANAEEMIRLAGITEQPVLVQFFIQPFARQLELNISGIFGPRSLEAFDIIELMNRDFSIILDNAHNPLSAPLVESKDGVKVAYLINFPGTGGTKTLVDVIRYNMTQILEATAPVK